MLDGHDHETLTMKVANKDGKEIILAEAGQADGKLATIGKLTIKEDGTITSELVAAKDVTVKDETVDAYVQNILNSFKDSVSKVVAKSDVELPDYNGDKRLGPQHGDRARRSRGGRLPRHDGRRHRHHERRRPAQAHP